MIDGINRGPGAGPLSPFAARSAPARTAAPGTADPARPLRDVRPAGLATGSAAGLVAELASAPPVNSVRVAQLQAQIAAGQFRIDPDAIAAAMLQLDRAKI